MISYCASKDFCEAICLWREDKLRTTHVACFLSNVWWMSVLKTQHLDKSLLWLSFPSLTINNLKRIHLKKTPSIIAPQGRVLSLITPSKQKFIKKSLICQFSFLKIPFASRKYLCHPILQGGQVCAFVATKKQPLKWMKLKLSIFWDALQD